MNSVSLFYPVLPQILLLQPPAWQSKRVLNGRKEIKSYNLFSTNVVWSHLGLGFFWELSPTFDRFVYVDLEMKYLVWKLVQHINRRKYQLFLKNQQSSFFKMKMFFFVAITSVLRILSVGKINKII